MFQGLYNLTSNIITHNRNLNVISNNMTNVSTPGYKNEKYMATTFREEMIYRSGNKDKSSKTPIGTMAMIRASDETITDYEQAGIENTEGILDFALTGPGFFQVQTNAGTGYTRNGSFSLDDQGYLTLQPGGRVMGENGPILLNTDKINVDPQGRITNEDGTINYGRIAVVDFADYNQLEKQDNGIYVSTAAATPTNTEVSWKSIEQSNVDQLQEMTDMMATQRNLQSSAQILKMYDQMMSKVTEIGRM